MTEWRRGEVPRDFGRKGTGDRGASNTLDKAQRIGVALLGGVRDTLPAAAVAVAFAGAQLCLLSATAALLRGVCAGGAGGLAEGK